MQGAAPVLLPHPAFPEDHTPQAAGAGAASLTRRAGQGPACASAAVGHFLRAFGSGSHPVGGKWSWPRGRANGEHTGSACRATTRWGVRKGSQKGQHSFGVHCDAASNGSSRGGGREALVPTHHEPRVPLQDRAGPECDPFLVAGPCPPHRHVGACTTVTFIVR